LIIQIGLEDNGLNIYKLIQQKKDDLFKTCQDWITNIYPIKDNVCTVEIDDNCIDNLCILLSDIIIENLEIRYLAGILKGEYTFLTEKEQCEILVYTLKNVWEKENSKEAILSAKIDVETRLLSVIDNNNEFILEGFMRFRMKDYLNHWNCELKKAINNYLSNQEYKEFIEVVKYFVNSKESKYSNVNVVIKPNNTFSIFDKNMAFIDDSNIITRNKLTSFNLENFDILLSILISLAPKKITIHDHDNIEDSLFIPTLKKIFDNRVFFAHKSPSN